MKVYLDYAATTPLDPQVLKAMLPYLQEDFANPSSTHTYGQKAHNAVETAREKVAKALGASPHQIIFTSGATEASNQALRALKSSTNHIITSRLEHKATLNTCKHLKRQGYEVTYLTPNEQGEITPEAVEAALENLNSNVLLALMLVNNETGVITNIPKISQIAYQAGALLFCDAVQAFANLPLDVKELGVDMLAISGHKVYGPKGIGILYIKDGLEIKPFLLGGEQERGLRAGTLNTPAIVGMGKAAQLAFECQENDLKSIAALRDYLQEKLLAIEDVFVNAVGASIGPKHLNIRVLGLDGEALLMGLDQEGIMVSGGSACAAGSLEPSHVLLAMGLKRNEAKASLRFSLGRGITYEMLDYTAEKFAKVVERCRKYR